MVGAFYIALASLFTYFSFCEAKWQGKINRIRLGKCILLIVCPYLAYIVFGLCYMLNTIIPVLQNLYKINFIDILGLKFEIGCRKFQISPSKEQSIYFLFCFRFKMLMIMCMQKMWNRL